MPAEIETVAPLKLIVDAVPIEVPSLDMPTDLLSTQV
jgi:hypothetical protein